MQCKDGDVPKFAWEFAKEQGGRLVGRVQVHAGRLVSDRSRASDGVESSADARAHAITNADEVHGICWDWDVGIGMGSDSSLCTYPCPQLWKT